MIARLILALLLAAFALPAMGASPCHDAAMAMPAIPAHQPMPGHDDKAVAAHVCIGCIPPSSWRGAGLGRMRPARAAIGRVTAPAMPIGIGTPPALPPPRIG